MAVQQSLLTLNHLFFHSVETFQRERLLSFASPDGPVVYSTERFRDAVLALRRYLLRSGLVEGDRVAILAENRPEWHVADFAILLARMVVVPIYIDLPASQIRTVLEHSGCRAAVVCGSKRCELLRRLAQDLPELRCIVPVDTALAEIVRDTPAPAAEEMETIRAEALAIDPAATASIVYTSGTTGAQKGVMLSHRSVMFDLERCVERLQVHTAAQALSVLPLSHAFERLLCYGYFRMGVPVAYGDPHALKELLSLHKPSVLGCVPRILEKIREAVESQVRTQPGWKQSIFQSLMRIGLSSTDRKGPGKPVPAGRKALYRFADALLFKRIRGQLGGLRYIICGGAWLNPAVEEFFRALGFVLVQGYGLTETSPVVCLGIPDHERTGTVGPPLDGVEVKLGENGEILTRGPHVMKGYYRDPEATAHALHDGWFSTGDLGRFDDEGNLTITGRVKELIVLSTGKNVSPSFAEEAILRSRFVQNAFGVGDGRKYLTALIVPHRVNVEEHSRSIGVSCASFEALLKAPEILALFREELELHQTELAAFERARRFSFLSEEALADPELVTPTQKVRRKVLELRYAESIDRMYSQEVGQP